VIAASGLDRSLAMVMDRSSELMTLKCRCFNLIVGESFRGSCFRGGCLAYNSNS